MGILNLFSAKIVKYIGFFRKFQIHRLIIFLSIKIKPITWVKDIPFKTSHISLEKINLICFSQIFQRGVYLHPTLLCRYNITPLFLILLTT